MSTGIGKLLHIQKRYREDKEYREKRKKLSRDYARRKIKEKNKK